MQKVANKIRNVNGILHKFKYDFPHIILFLIYTSSIKSRINYCILLWGTNYDKIFKLQNQAIRTILVNHFKTYTSPLFKSMNLLDIRFTKKTFDKVWTDGLLLKLRRCNISGNMFKWIKSYTHTIPEEQGLSLIITEARRYSSVIVYHKVEFCHQPSL